MANHTLDDYCCALRTELDLIRDTNATFTSLSNCMKDFCWRSPRRTVIRIEVLVVVITIMQLFLAMFGSWRRRSRNFFVQKGVLAAYTLSSSLISYTLGSMQSSTVKSSMYSVWAVCVHILFGCADSITAYSLTDNNQLTRQIYQFVLGITYVISIMTSTLDLQTGIGVVCNIVFCLLLIIPLYSFAQRVWACELASESWNMNKMVADYMYQEHTMGEHYDPVSMTGYHYLVTLLPFCKSKLGSGISYVTQLSKGSDKIIDIEKVWQNNLLSTDLKDACLSFSLFHLLRRRFFGFECGESPLQKTRDFVFKGLLAKKKNDGPTGEAAIDYDWVFKVIEVELAFMYDFFFTKYAAYYYGNPFFRYVAFVLASLMVVAAFLTAEGMLQVSYYERIFSIVLDNKPADVVITLLILGCIALFHVVKMLHYWTTIWGRVSFACHVVRRGCCCMRFREFFVKIGVFLSNRCRHEEKLGQYSLLESVSHHSKPFKVYLDLFLDLLRSGGHDMFVLATVSRIVLFDRPFHGKLTARKPGDPIKLPANVRKALVLCLERTQGILTNGESSLLSSRAPGADGLLWACRHDTDLNTSTSCSQKKENQAVYIILTWHIATCYCDCDNMGADGLVREELKDHHVIATILSKYCAYLVVSAPKLLPGHHYDTRCAFERVVEEATKALEHTTDIYDAMRSLALQPNNLREANETVFHKGVRLGKQLEEMEEGARWKVLADFWAEMLLYLAPSDNVKEHVECLAKGGEFITHLWALLTHAGILHRGQRNVVADDIENPGDVGDTRDSGTDQQDPGELPYGAALRLRQASSYLDKCAEGAASAAARATNKPALRGNCAHTVGMMVHQPANPVQSGEGAPNDASNGLSEIQAIA